MFRGKRQFYNIIDTIDLIGGYSHFLHLLSIERSVVIDVIYNFLESYALNLAKTFAVHTLNALIPNHYVSGITSCMNLFFDINMLQSKGFIWKNDLLSRLFYRILLHFLGFNYEF